MYERFTDRARKVVQLALQESLRIGVEYIATEHVLAGLLKEGNGVGAHVLANLGCDLKGVRDIIDANTPKPTGPEPIILGRIPMTPQVKLAMVQAQEFAGECGHNYIGTEHLLVGLTRAADGLAAVILTQLGATPERVRAEVLMMVKQPTTCPTTDGGPTRSMYSRAVTIWSDDPT